MSGRAARWSKQRKVMERMTRRPLTGKELGEFALKVLKELIRKDFVRGKTSEFHSVLGPTPRVLRGRNVERQGTVGEETIPVLP